MPQNRMPSIADPIIDLHQVTKIYKGVAAVDSIDLQIRSGEIFGILGPNGAGKTTTLEMIEGLRAPDRGSIHVNGLDAVTQAEAVRKIIGVQLQSTSMFPYLNARELVELFASLYGVRNPRQRAQELLASVNLQDKATSRVEELSGGQQQRLSIALALVNQPVVTFLDEPTTGLDPHARRSLWETILRVREAGTTVVLTTHYMDEAERLCDRIAIMDAGKVIACDTPERLIASLPQAATVTAVFSAQLRDALPVSELRAVAGVNDAATEEDGGAIRARLSTTNVQDTLVGVLRFAEEADVRLTELSSTRPTLEDVFLALTGRTYEQDDLAPTAGID